MTNYKGRDFGLKLGTWSGGALVADCRTHSLRINNEQVDITNKSSNGFRTLLEGAGVKAVEISVGGLISDAASSETLQNYAVNNSINAMAMGWADGDTLEGSFAISNFEITGEYNNEQQFTATLQSSGAYTFTAA